MSKHTAGPWAYDGKLATFHRVIGQIGTYRGDGSDHVCNAFTESNARLIAAAPELLEALEDMVEIVDSEVPFAADTTADARAIIAKARGTA